MSVDDAPLSLIRRIHNGWRVQDDRVLFQARIAGAEPSGLYLAEAGSPQQHFIPHLVQGRFDRLQYQTALLLRNGDVRPASVSIRLFDSAGRNGPLVGGQQLAPGEVKRIELDLQEPFAGWARVDASGGSIQVFVRISARQTGRLVSQLTIPSVERRLDGFWPDGRGLAAANDGGLAVSNPYNAPIRVRIGLLGQGLAILGQTEVEIAAKGHRALLFSELFPSRACCSGFFRLGSDVPVPAVSLLLNGFRIAAQPIFHSAER